MAIPYLVCDDNGEILVMDIISTINKLIDRIKDIDICCDEMKMRQHIRTERVDSILYITDAGSAPI